MAATATTSTQGSWRSPLATLGTSTVLGVSSAVPKTMEASGHYPDDGASHSGHEENMGENALRSLTGAQSGEVEGASEPGNALVPNNGKQPDREEAQCHGAGLAEHIGHRGLTRRSSVLRPPIGAIHSCELDKICPFHRKTVPLA